MSDNQPTQPDGQQQPTLTTRQGHPVYDNQNLRTVGDRGPTTLENYPFIEKISHFDRERIPERVVHARGTGAHGYFEAYGSVGDERIDTYTRAKLFQEKGKRTPVFVRFSTVTHGGHSPETLRDPRGFAVKFYTEDGNWDLVGNNLKVFFIRDAIKFPDFVHSWKPDPVFNRQDPNRQFDFVQYTPEAMHMVTWLFSPWGIAADYRHMEGSGVNTYKWVNKAGEGALVKYHWVPKQGVKNLTQAQAAELQGKNFLHATQDLYEAIERGDYPEWEIRVQIMPDGGTLSLPSTRSTTPSSGPRTSSRCGRWGAWCSTATRRTTSPRSSRPPSVPVCWSTASTSRTIRCCRAARSRTRTRSATAWVRTTCNCRSTGPRAMPRRTSATGR